MVYKEEKRDLFTVDESYYLAHCISADFALGAGIAVEFDRRFDCKNKLNKMWRSWTNRVGYTFLTDRVFNLVTKEKYWQKPTLSTMKSALRNMKNQAIVRDIEKIAMPMIGCGLDKLKWDDVSSLIKEVFGETDIEILVCYR